MQKIRVYHTNGLLQKTASYEYGSGHEGAAVLLPGFAINW